ncbi:hypothetical protein AB6N23_12140 [Cellulomonas sp. 179-A 9B4 NHS]|uniref:hypothetical protein n=1 Tax=Cellulomonas sp. 179-A 9B4 NHS TaxID=3142379 RepID=UPI0039A04B44
MSRDVTGTGATEQEPTEVADTQEAPTSSDDGLAAALDEDSPTPNPQGPRGDDPTFDRTGDPVEPSSGGDLDGDPLVRHDGQGDDR